MIRVRALKAAMVKQGLTQAEVARYLKMSSGAFSARLKRGVFGSDEIEAMTSLLDIQNPMEIFFSQEVS